MPFSQHENIGGDLSGHITVDSCYLGLALSLGISSKTVTDKGGMTVQSKKKLVLKYGSKKIKVGLQLLSAN